MQPQECPTLLPKEPSMCFSSLESTNSDSKKESNFKFVHFFSFFFSISHLLFLVQKGVLSLISAHQSPLIVQIENELKIKLSDPEQQTLKIKVNLVSRFGIDPRTCKIITFGGGKDNKGIHRSSERVPLQRNRSFQLSGISGPRRRRH